MECCPRQWSPRRTGPSTGHSTCVCLPGPRPPTLHGHVVHRQLQALATPHHPHRVPLIVIELVPRKEGLGAFTCSTNGGVSMAPVHAHIYSPGMQPRRPQLCAHRFTHHLRHISGCATCPCTQVHTHMSRAFYTPRHTQYCHSVQYPREPLEENQCEPCLQSCALRPCT